MNFMTRKKWKGLKTEATVLLILYLLTEDKERDEHHRGTQPRQLPVQCTINSSTRVFAPNWLFE